MDTIAEAGETQFIQLQCNSVELRQCIVVERQRQGEDYLVAAVFSAVQERRGLQGAVVCSAQSRAEERPTEVLQQCIVEQRRGEQMPTSRCCSLQCSAGQS